jgi:SAM-dependent methyltransferase
MTTPWFDRFFRHEYLAFDDHPHTDLEIDFLQNVLQLSEEDLVLDLGCGYGRHSIPLNKAGIDIIGLDRSPTMLHTARARASEEDLAISFIQADMRDLPFAQSFDAVISMFSSLGYFEDENENFRVIQNISDALVPEGLFLLETANRDFVVAHNPPVQIYRPDKMLLIEERTFDPITSRSLVDVTIVQNGRETHLHHAIRLYAFTELDMLLASVGLAVQSVWGNFRGGEFGVDSPQMIILAQKV